MGDCTHCNTKEDNPAEEAQDSTDRDKETPAVAVIPVVPVEAPAAALPSLRRYTATLMIERKVTVNAVSDDDFQDAVLEIMESELDRNKYRLLQIHQRSSPAHWS